VRKTTGRVVPLVLFGALLSSFSPATATQSDRLRTGIYHNADGSPLIDLIEQSRSTLDIEIYEMDDNKVLSSIRRAIERGVRVRIVKEPDPVGAGCKVFESGDDVAAQSVTAVGDSRNCDDQRRLVREVKRAGGAYVPFTKPDLCGGNGEKNCLQHGKLVIADGRYALVSTGNFNATNLCDLDQQPAACDRDYSYLSNDRDVVDTLEAVIENDLKGEAYDVAGVIKPGAERKVSIGPVSLRQLVSFLRSAKKSIRLENQYLKEPTINATLVEAAKHGIRVEITLASACSFGRPRDTEARKLTNIFTQFDEAGISTRMFTKNIKINGENGYLHAKAIIIDGVRAWVGSVNGSQQATSLNREFGLFFYDSEDIQALGRIMDADHRDSNGESWRESLDCAENE
jgi:phosphatidylserine/phosphatidylglycerophosphate/cardiolipin synthase-like enzyme